MNNKKRFFDIIVALTLLTAVAPLIALIGFLILLLDGRPVFYLSPRMKTMDKEFPLIKFRTMKTAPTDSGVSGGDKASRITPLGNFLRRTRLDELPQLANVVLGHVSFVGPRPPLRQYVENFPEIYAEVLKSRPGITGLASIHFHRHEAWLLSKCETAEETDRVYVSTCIPRKARLDMIYQEHQSLCFDVVLMFRTVLKVVSR